MAKKSAAKSKMDFQITNVFYRHKICATNVVLFIVAKKNATKDPFGNLWHTEKVPLKGFSGSVSSDTFSMR